MNFTIGSLFDGSGGFPLAGSLCGIEPVWMSEVEPYPIAVTKSRFDGRADSPLLQIARKHFPEMKLFSKHLGNICEINGAEVEPVDVITFGSPCQDLSVAGKRAGLKHEANGDEETTRSGLFLEAVRIIKEMRDATNGKYPSFALWENVPGAFSSNKGEDFRVVLEELIKIVEPSATVPPPDKNGWPYADCYVGAGWSLAYRVFDAQFWGVPQRRRRIHLVLDLRGECAEKVLFERSGLRGYFAEGRTPWQGIAADAERSTGAADREGAVGLTPLTLKIRSGCEGGGKGALIQTDKSATLSTLSTLNDQYLFQPITLEPGIAAREGGHIYDGVSGTLRANAGDNQMAVAYAENLVLDDQGGSQISVRTDGKSPTLRAEMHGNVPCVLDTKVYESHPMDSRIKELDDDVSPTVSVKWHKGAADTPLVCTKEQYLFENHSQDTRYKGPLDVCPMLPAQLGTGGNNTPFVVEKDSAIPIHDQATRFSGKRGDKSDGKGNGLGVGEPGDPMNTLTSGDRHAVAYAMQGFGDYKESEVASGLKARDHKDATDLVAETQPIVFDKEVYNSGETANGGHYIAEGGPAPSLRTEHPPGVCVRYIVRRLTPTECARLQGFADRWGDIDPKSDFSDAEYSFWMEVRNTHARINGKAEKEYTKAQMLTWYNKLLTDSSEYKMWGNGICVFPAIYCMQGIVDALTRYSERGADCGKS